MDLAKSPSPNTAHVKPTQPGPSPPITLRPFTASDADADAFLSWASDDRVMRYFGPPCTDRPAALAHIQAHIIPHPWYRAVCLGDGRPVGWVSVLPLGPDRPHRASMGYGLAHEYWARGIMPAAVTAAAGTVFGAWPWLERLEAFASTENTRSQRVLKKAGFRKEGVLRKYARLMGVAMDVVMSSLLRTDLE